MIIGHSFCQAVVNEKRENDSENHIEIDKRVPILVIYLISKDYRKSDS
jgi:hypothetical protein